MICSANQMTGFYMKCDTGLKLVNLVPSNLFERKKDSQVICKCAELKISIPAGAGIGK